MIAKILKLAKTYSVEIMDCVTTRIDNNKQKYDIFLKRSDGTIQNYVTSHQIGKAGTKDTLTIDFEKFLKGLPFKQSNLVYSFKP